MRVGIDLSPLCETPVTGVGRALAHLLVGLGRTRGRGDVLVGYQRPWRLPEFEGTRWTERCMVGSVADAPSAWRRALVRSVGKEPVDAFVSPWSAFPDLDVPLVVVVHELPFVRWGPIEGVRRSLAHRLWLRRDVARAARIVVPSNATRDDLLRLHPAAAPKVAVIPHGFDPALWERSRRRPWQRGRRGIVVGARNPRKGLDVFLDAEERLRDLEVHWVLVGRPPAALESRVARTPRMEVRAEPSDMLLRRALHVSDVLVYPSRSEGFGYPPLEAMAAGCPVVATTGGSIPEVCGDAALLVPPDDADSLARGVRDVLLDSGVAENLTRRGRIRCHAFPPEDAGARWWSLLRRVANGER